MSKWCNSLLTSQCSKSTEKTGDRREARKKRQAQRCNCNVKRKRMGEVREAGEAAEGYLRESSGITAM